MVLCYKFNDDIKKSEIDSHMNGFRELKKMNEEIVGYTSGYTSTLENSKPAYDVMHYLTFRTENDVLKFKNSDTFKKFIEENKSKWSSEFIINAEIK